MKQKIAWMQEELDQARNSEKAAMESKKSCSAKMDVLADQNEKFESEFGSLKLQIKTMQKEIKEDYQITSDYSGPTMKFLDVIGNELDFDRYEELGNSSVSKKLWMD